MDEYLGKLSSALLIKEKAVSDVTDPKYRPFLRPFDDEPSEAVIGRL